jgi:tetratricopeptide (TPR) repeat protein
MNKGADRLIYRLAEAELDPLSGQVKRRGAELYLRPRSLQVLLYLIEQRPRLVLKEELMEQIWQGAAVTDDALVQCLANAYLEVGRLDEAIAEYERILRVNPRYPLIAYHLGQIYERKGETARARAAYEQFLQDWRAANADIPEVRQATAWLASPR